MTGVSDAGGDCARLGWDAPLLLDSGRERQEEGRGKLAARPLGWHRCKWLLLMGRGMGGIMDRIGEPLDIQEDV